MLREVMRRILSLEARAVPDVCFCLVEKPDGTEAEETMESWYEHRHEWQWKRMTRGDDPRVLSLLFAAFDEECGMEDEARQEANKYFDSVGRER